MPLPQIRLSGSAVRNLVCAVPIAILVVVVAILALISLVGRESLRGHVLVMTRELTNMAGVLLGTSPLVAEPDEKTGV